MGTRIKYYATRESSVSAVEWDGGDAAFNLIRQWGAQVQRNGDILILQEPQHTETIRKGDHIVRVDDNFFKYTPDDLDEIYVEARYES